MSLEKNGIYLVIYPMDNLVDSDMMSRRHTSLHSVNHHLTDYCYYHRLLADIGIDCCPIPNTMTTTMTIANTNKLRRSDIIISVSQNVVQK